MNLKFLLSFYLNLGRYLDCFLYRKSGIIFINIYQIFFRKSLNRECQFKISCSNFLKKHLAETRNFETLFSKVNIRILDCSEPLKISFSLKSNLVATGLSHKKYRENELSILVIKNFKNKL